MAQNPIPARKTIPNRVYKTVHGIFVKPLGVGSMDEVFVTLIEFDASSPIVHISGEYPLYELSDADELPNSSRADITRLDTRIGYTLHKLKERGHEGVHIDTLVKELQSRNLLSATEEDTVIRHDLYLSVRNLRAKGHNVVRIGDFYYYKGIL